MEKNCKEQLLTYLDQVLELESKKIVGKLLKRFEIIVPESPEENKLISNIYAILKKETKEILYESFRDIRDIFYAYSKGLEMSQFKFIESNKEK